MQMPDRLPGLFPAIDDQSVPGLGEVSLTRELVGEQDHLRHEIALGFGNVGERTDMLRRNNQEVGWRLRIDVAHRDQPIRLSYEFCRQHAPYDPAEEALVCIRGGGGRMIRLSRDLARHVLAGASFAGEEAATGSFSFDAASVAVFSLSVSQHRFLQKYFPFR